jgi:hypothetical protein
LDPLSLIAGLAMFGLGVAFLTRTITLTDVRTEWVLPVAALGLGAGLLLSAAGSRTRTETGTGDASDAEGTEVTTPMAANAEHTDEGR